MSPTEEHRDAIRRALAEVVGDDIADRMMESLPPFPWHEVARQGDMVALRGDVEELRADVRGLQTDVRVIRETLDLRFDSLRDSLSAQFHADLLAHSRVMFFSMLVAVFTAASLAFAAVRL